MITVGLLVPAPLLKVKVGRSKKRRIRIMITGMIIIAVAAVTIAFAASANAAGTNATNVATSAEKSSQIGKQIGKEYYDSIPTGGTELEEFMAIGGTFIMPAVNSTHLYREIKKVYDKLPEDVARYLALQINSGAARGKFPNDALIKLVKKHSAENWRELCMDYTWEWSSRVGGIGPKNVPAEMKSDADKKADTAITRAEKFIDKGNRRYEGFLRSIPQWKIMQVLMEFKGNP